MTRGEIKQAKRMKWILFYIFVTIFVLVVAGTIATVFFDYGKPSPEERNLLFNVFIGEVGVAILALFKVLFGLKKNPVVEEEPVPRIAGKYKYELVACDNKTQFQGNCRVKQEGRVLEFNGERKKESSGLKRKKVSFRWFSHWAELCADNKVRLDYAIANKNGGLRGYAILDVEKKKRSDMVGECYIMGQSCLYGTMKFKRA